MYTLDSVSWDSSCNLFASTLFGVFILTKFHYKLILSESSSSSLYSIFFGLFYFCIVYTVLKQRGCFCWSVHIIRLYTCSVTRFWCRPFFPYTKHHFHYESIVYTSSFFDTKFFAGQCILRNKQKVDENFEKNNNNNLSIGKNQWAGCSITTLFMEIAHWNFKHTILVLQHRFRVQAFTEFKSTEIWINALFSIWVSAVGDASRWFTFFFTWFRTPVVVIVVLVVSDLVMSILASFCFSSIHKMVQSARRRTSRNVRICCKSLIWNEKNNFSNILNETLKTEIEKSGKNRIETVMTRTCRCVTVNWNSHSMHVSNEYRLLWWPTTESKKEWMNE